MLGLGRHEVKLSTHNNEWQSLFLKEKELLKMTLGDIAVGIEHIGSTSIHGLLAKPVLDIAVGVRALKNAQGIEALLQKAGYIFRRTYPRPHMEILFVKEKNDRGTHYLHVMRWNGVKWNHDLLFRNYLRTHPERAKEYVELKQKLAKEFKNDRVSYTKSKSPFILETLKMAMEEKRANRPT